MAKSEGIGRVPRQSVPGPKTVWRSRLREYPKPQISPGVWWEPSALAEGSNASALRERVRLRSWALAPASKPGLKRLRKKPLLRIESGPQRLKPDLFSISYVRAKARTLQKPYGLKPDLFSISYVRAKARTLQKPYGLKPDLFSISYCTG